MSSQPPPPLKKVKVTLLGDAGMGKSSLAQRIFNNRFHEFEEATIGAAYMVMRQGDTRLECWDTAGQERYRCLIPMYTRGADVVWLVVEAGDDKKEEQIAYWMKLLTESVPEECTVVRVVNKLDLVEKKPPMPYRENNPVFYTSAKTGEGCDELIEYTFTKSRMHPEAGPPAFAIHMGKSEAPPQYCC